MGNLPAVSRRAVRTIFLVLALAAAACGSEGGEQARAPAGPEGGELTDLQNFATGEPDHIDPGLAGVLQGAQIGELLFDGLVAFDFSERDAPVLRGQVASSWETTDDGKTWVFELKDEQVFSNGEPVEPSHFVAAWNLHASAKYASEISYHFAPIQGAEEVTAGNATEMSGLAADDENNTLTVTLTEPLAEFPAIVSHPVFAPKLPEGIQAGADYEQGLMVGNGPFKLAEPWEHEVQIVLERNDRWNGGIYPAGTKAKLDRIVFRISQDIDSAYADFEAGNGHTASIPSGRFAEATERYPNATEPSLGVYHFFVNLEGKLGGAQNLKLRQAISLAINREAINDAVYDGTRRLPNGMTPPGLPGFEAGLCGDLCEFDLTRARRLLQEWRSAGASVQEPIVINFNSGSGHEDVVAIIQQNLRELGLESRLDGRDPTTYFSEMRDGACELCRAGWIWDYPSFDNATYALFHSGSIGGDNIGRLKSPAVDRAISEARRTLDDDARYELYRNAERLALQQLPLIPVNWYAGAIVYREDVGNFIYTPLQFVLYEQVTVEQ